VASAVCRRPALAGELAAAVKCGLDGGCEAVGLGIEFDFEFLFHCVSIGNVAMNNEKELMPLWECLVRLLLDCPLRLPFWLPVWYFWNLLGTISHIRVWGVEWDPAIPFAAFWLRGILVWVFGIWPLFQLVWNMISKYENPYVLKTKKNAPVLLLSRRWQRILLEWLGVAIPIFSTCIRDSEEFARVMHSLNGKWPLLYAAVRPWLVN